MHPLATHPDRTGPSRPRRAAFTLIEILVAIGVVVALIAVAVPTIVLSFGDRNLEAEAERLGATMASLRAEAVRQRQTLALFLEPASGAFGGALFIGPLSSDESESVRLPGDRPLGWGGPSEAGETPTRRIFEAERPFVLGTEPPDAELNSMVGSGAIGPATTGEAFANEGPAERVRVAVCSASGQILASSPLWLSDERAMFRVEVGSGVGNAIVTGPRMIIARPLINEDAEFDDDAASALPDRSGSAPPAGPNDGNDEPEGP